MTTIGHSLADGWWMLWQTLWALVIGFGLSGAVQAFVSRARMQQALGDHRPRAVAKAGLLGMASSSCSYAAAAMAKTMFGRGADFTASQVFMFASTNLVIELGLVLWLLLGWQFALAEFVGGAIMLVLLTVALPRVIPDREIKAARSRLTDGATDHAGHREAATRTRIRSLGGWAEAAAYTVGDLNMVRKELLIGFVIAGFADTAVPLSFWRSLFITGHGFGSALQNVVLGPLLAVISFVCSIGNVPLAAALWSGRIGFGGVLSFIFADLITLPLLLIYRRYYGAGITAKLLATFWTTMSVAGLATEYLFKALQITPPALAHGKAGTDHWGLNATTVLDLVAIVVLIGIVALARNRDRLGGSAAEPVCEHHAAHAA